MADIVRREGNGPLARRMREWDPLERMRDLWRWDPFQEMAGLFRGEGPAQPAGTGFAPAVDLRETADSFIIKADLPGMREQDVEITVTGNRMRITGHREEEKVEQSDTYYCAERSSGNFMRSFTLPDGANFDQVSAEMREGVLTIHVPKSAGTQPKKIAIRGARGAQGAKA
jgi:HSP20 family protein